MDKSISSDGRNPSLSPTIASILGLREPLRIRPHGSTQKPHVVMRRVEVSEEVGDDGKKMKIVYYSLFASKRIEVKPGKEILLAIPDSIYNDTPLAFGGELPDIQKESEKKYENDTSGKDASTEAEEPVNQAVPPKMRKAWKARSLAGKETAELSAPGPSEPLPPPSRHVSVAVQAQLDYVSEGTQAQPSCSSQSVQASTITKSSSCQISPSYTSSSIQVEPPPVAPHVQPIDTALDSRRRSGKLLDLIDPSREATSSSVQVEPPPATSHVNQADCVTEERKRFVKLRKSIEAAQPPLNCKGPIDPTPRDADNVIVRQRSLSPMELDSPSSSPPHSPTGAVSIRTQSYDSLASSRAGSVPRQAEPTRSTTSDSRLAKLPSPSPLPASSSPHVAHRNTPVDDAKPIGPGTSTKPAQAKAQLSSLPLSEASSSTLQPPGMFLGKRGRSPPTGPRSLAGYDAGGTKEIPRVPAAPVPHATAGHSRGIPVAPAAFLTIPAIAPPTAPAALLSAASNSAANGTHGSQSNFKPIGTARPAIQTSAEWKPASFAPITPTPSPLGNPLGIRPSAPPPMRHGVSIKTNKPPKAPAVLSISKKPVVVGSAWPPGRNQAQTNSPSPSPATVTTSAGSTKPITPPDHAPLPVPTPPQSTPKNAGSNASSSATQLPGIVSYRSPSPEVTARALAPRQKSISATPVRFVSKGLHSSAAPSSSSSNIAAKVEPPKRPSPQVKVEEHSPLPQKPGKGNLADVLAGAGPTTAEFDHPPGLVIGNKLNESTVPTKAALPLAPVTVKHPLPPKPVTTVGPSPHKYEPSRPVIGVKRSAAMAARESDGTRKKSFKWSVVEPIHTTQVRPHGITGIREDTGVRGIAFNSNGSQFAVNCQDDTVRIWNSDSRMESAMLAHRAPVVSVAWMDDDAGIVSLSNNGIINKWVRLGQYNWHWAKILDSGRADDDPTCFAYMRDRIAVAYPRTGVKVWLWVKGTWQPQRSILRQNVTAIRFVDDGNALIGGTTDGVMWYCQVPNGTLRAYAFFKTKVYHLDVNVPGTHALVAHNGGQCHLVGIKEDDHRGKVERAYMLKDKNATYNFGAIFANADKSVLWGVLEGCALVWDRTTAEVACGLDHGDEVVQAVASFGAIAGSSKHCLVTGTKHGHLMWWPHSPTNVDSPRKRMKSADLD
ncbi:hypothetical protein OE88DRAFT_1667698 [Heliocybe sulcata]|uniref:Uncharacterized protein n=1 Tax=Heliocybe sulcata TaxID=5364 RepID=A0A5C3MY13_9AGAM|nr:hypothetical protein OE88DRAFT_1667698 [Heliocybe sulcata]